jgi:hypothetical protein
LASRFKQILNAIGETVTFHPEGGEPTEIKAVISPARADEIIIEPGYITTDYITVYTSAPLQHRDKIKREDITYEVYGVQMFSWKGETAYFKANCRRLGQ